MTVFIFCLVAVHVIAAWIYIRRAQSTPTLGEAYRDENLNRHSDPL